MMYQAIGRRWVYDTPGSDALIVRINRRRAQLGKYQAMLQSVYIHATVLLPGRLFSHIMHERLTSVRLNIKLGRPLWAGRVVGNM
jgi:hypothetical protein